MLLIQMSHFIRKFVPHFIHPTFNRLSSSQVQVCASFDSFTVKYFIDRCGFSRDNAVSASKYVNFDKPGASSSLIIFNRCVAFFKKHGFTDTHLLKLLKTCPKLVTCDPEKTLLPKIQFLQSKGFLEREILAMLAIEPDIFVRSLEGHLVPIFNLLKYRLGSVEITIKAIKRCPMILPRFRARVRPNIQLLEKAGVPRRCIAFALNTQPVLFASSCDRMKEVVEDIKKMGIEPRSWQFISGVCAMGSLSISAWNNKLKVYQRWDCSEEEVVTAFKKVPRCMTVSEEKIEGVMGFFVNEMGWRPQMLLLTPKLFIYSLQNRIVPRCSVYKLLRSKGLLKVECSLYTVLTYSEDKFLEKFINCYPEEALELLRYYEEKMKNSNGHI